MQKLEAAGAFDSNILHPGDVRDPESFKVRRGKVGGYREYLSVEGPGICCKRAGRTGFSSLATVSETREPVTPVNTAK